MIRVTVILGLLVAACIVGIVMVVRSLRHREPPPLPRDPGVPPPLPFKPAVPAWKVILMVALSLCVMGAGFSMLVLAACGGWNLKI